MDNQPFKHTWKSPGSSKSALGATGRLSLSSLVVRGAIQPYDSTALGAIGHGA